MCGGETRALAGAAAQVDPQDAVYLYDLDGTLTGISLDNAEGGSYLQAAVERLVFDVSELTSGRSNRDVERRIRDVIDTEVFPNRQAPRYWAQFPTVQGQDARVCPSVDHYLLVQYGMKVFLNRCLEEAPRDSFFATQISGFLASEDWINHIYVHASGASLPNASIEEDAREVLESERAKGRLVAVFTNSSVNKAETLLRKAGFGDRLAIDRLEAGRVGIFGRGKKAEIDSKWFSPPDSPFGDVANVSHFFGEEALVDLRRRTYHEKVAEIMKKSGRHTAVMFGDIVCLELLPFANWQQFSPVACMRTTPMSAPGEIAAATALFGGRVAARLSDLVAMI